MFKQLKLWKKIITVNKRSVVNQSISYLVCVVCALVSPIALSHFIGLVSNGEFSGALLWLGIDLALKILEQLSWHFNYSNFTSLIAPTYMKLQAKMTECALVNSNKEFQENFDFVMANDISTIATFIDKLLLRISNLIKFLVVTGIVIYYSYAIGTIILAVSALGYFILVFYAMQRKKIDKEVFNKEMYASHKLDEINQKKDIIKKYNLQSAVAYESERRFYSYVGSYNKSTKNKSAKDNLLQIYWYIMIAICLAILVYQFRESTISIVVFLAIYNYLLMYSSITRNIFDFKIEAEELGVAIARFNDLTNIESELEKERIEEIKEISIPKMNTRINAKEKFVNVKQGEIVAFKSEKYRWLFSMPPKDFTINGVDISSIDFDRICKVVSYKNEMFDDSIIENLQIIDNDTKRIFVLIQNLGLADFVKALPSGEYTNISDNKDETINFKFNLIRAILSTSKIIFLDIEKIDDADLLMVLKTILVNSEGRTYFLLDKENRVKRKKIINVE